MLTFTKLIRSHSQTRAFTGLGVSELQEFAAIYQPVWDEHRLALPKSDRKRAVGGGRKLALAKFEDRLLVFLVYAKLYCTYDLLGYLFNVNPATICRTIADIRSVVGDKLLVSQTGRRIRTIDELLSVYPELEEVILDATEQKIPRPKNKKKRKSHHSGKKQAFTIMTQVLSGLDSLMLHVSAPMPGRGHDVRLFKKSAVPGWLGKHRTIHALADGGYQGMDKQYPDIHMTTPVKRSKKKPELTKPEQRSNKRHSSKRIAVEHSFGGVKQFQLLSGIYRNKEKHYKQYFVAIASIRNFRLLSRQKAAQVQAA
jgi:hypothetical protein